ncbi:SH3 domain-containing protein [Pelagibacterium lentulum]|uniref:SH3b domain-containing protein n=1 Tax=Pelagibacterium lentulum TaxID=2029865 RepID=A0A916R916_9HYPH|nr:SH3 domain-containing protein [Pelagibacterium lentulum]GGA45303.1 hypothetical protein GCM10011499_13760 [Pelagibacterium lentulum]
MALNKTVFRGGLAALMVMVMTAGAYAWSATATTTVNVRQGPGTQFRVVDVLERGERVQVDYCRSGWCLIERRGYYGGEGWVSERYLSSGGYHRPRPPVYQPPRPRPPYYHPPRPRPPYWEHPRPRPPHYRPPSHRPPSTGGQVCFDGPNGYFCFGN